MTIQYYWDLQQGTDEWLEVRRGILTASEMKLIMTPTLKATYDKSRTHLYELVAQRISGFVEPTYMSDDMMRGNVDEVLALEQYNKIYGGLKKCGFVTNDKWGYVLGYSPDGLVDDAGLVECKSRRQKYQVQTIIDNEMPTEHILQVQTGMMVTERDWCDYISYCGGLPMFVKRIYADEEVQKAIYEAALDFHTKLDDLLNQYGVQLLENTENLSPTQRITYDEEIY